MKFKIKFASTALAFLLTFCVTVDAFASATEDTQSISPWFNADYDSDFPFNIEYHINYNTVEIKIRYQNDFTIFFIKFTVKLWHFSLRMSS